VPGGIGSTGGTSNINFNSGIIGLATGDFTRSLGNTASTVQFGNPGGWAAYGADRTVNLGGAAASVTWATATTGLNGKTLILGHPTATHMVDIQNPLDMTNGGRTVQVDNGAAAIDGILSGNITGIAGGNLTKTGDGTLALTGTNNYLGTTTINAGTLLVTGTNSGGGAFTVNAAGTLGGAGTVSGLVTASAGGRINLGDGAVGTLSLTKTVTSLTLSGTAATPNHLFFDLGNGAGGTDKIVTAATHAAATANGALVHLNQLSGGTVNPGTYTLIQGGAASTFTGYTLATERAGRNVYSALGASGNDLQVTVAAGNPGPADSFAYWRGETQTDWDIAQWYSDAAGTSTSTMPGYSSNVRFATANVNNLTTNLFTDFEINSLTVDAGLAGPVTIATKMLTLGATNDNGNTAGNGITANNANGTTISSRVGLGNSQTWTVGTGAALTVSGAVSDFGNGHALTKAGAGTLTLTGVNTFSGPLTVSGGTLDIGGAGQLNSGSHGANIVNNGTLSYSSSVNQTLSGIISGTGSLTKSGGSTLTLNNGGTFTGGATISGGTLSLGVANLVNPLGSGTTTVNTGGTYALSATLITAPLVMNGGTVTAGNSFGSSINGPVTLDANSTISISGNLTINSNISGTGGLTKSLGAFVPLNGTNNDYSGPTVISAGGLTIKSSLYGNDTAKWIPDNITVNSGAALVMNVGGAGEFTIAQAGLMFSQLGGTVNNNGLRAGSQFGVDLRTAGGSFTISDNLIDSSGPGGGAVGFRIVGNGTVGAATVELSGNNTYSGVTVVDRNGTIKVSSLNSVDIADLDPGLPLATSSLGRPTTVANGTIQLGSNASFQGGSLTYTGTGETTDRVLNLGGANGTTYRLDQSGTGLLKFTSPFTITDNRGVKTIELQGSTDGTGEIAGAIPFGQSSALPNRLTKSGTGTWTLSAANLYDGVTTVNGGALVLANAEALKGGIGATGGLGALTFNGGVIGLGAGDFFRPLVAENTIGGVNFKNTAGGWAAYGANRVVNLGGASAAITWATANTGLNGRTLILGNATATHTVDFQNPLDLGTATRTVQVDDGAAAIDGTLSGALSGTGALTKTGDGTLALTGTNSRTGGTNVNAGTLTINGPLADATMNIASGATVNGNGALTFNIDGTTADQIVDNGTINLTNLSIAVNATGSGLTETEYVLVDATGGGLITGTFAGISGAGSYILNYSTPNQVKLVLPAGTPYDTWAGGTFANPFTNTAKNVDFDNDGLSNLLEFVLGGDPTISQAGIAPSVSTSGSNLVVTFKRSDDSELAPAVTVKVELSTDLTFSTPAQDITIGAASDPGPIAPSGASYTVSNSGGFDTITVTIPQGSDPKKFARVSAVSP
jgi:autotransporter-associated beta strand protein